MQNETHIEKRQRKKQQNKQPSNCRKRNLDKWLCEIANKHAVNYDYEQRLARRHSNMICTEYSIKRGK